MTGPRDNNNQELRRAIAASLFAIGLGFDAAGAQDAGGDENLVEEIVVTGSRLLRRDFSAPSPIVTVDAGEIRLAGATNVEDLLNTLPQVIPDHDRTTNNGGGTARINLRGLGANRTLVMLNGRRFAPSGVNGAVDINSIPAALTERVEVVTGGASAVYGSDAVVGVVNFVMDDRFSGLEINTQYDVTDAGDGDVLDLSVSGGLGFAGGRGHVTGFFNYNDRSAVFAGEREFTSVVILDDSSTGETFEAGSFSIPEGLIVFPETIIGGVPVRPTLFEQDATLRPAVIPDDLFNYAPDNYLQVPLKRYVAAGFLGFDVMENITATIEGMYSRNEIDQQLAPVPTTGFIRTNVDNPFLPAATQQIVGDSFDPDGDGFAEFVFRRRMVESAPRRLEDTRISMRLLVALEGRFSDDWQWQAYASATDTDVNPTRVNDMSRRRYQQSLLVDPSTGACLDPSGGCVPANVFGAGKVSPEAVAFMRLDTIEDQEEVEERIFSASATGNVFDMPAGHLGMVAGVEWRRLDAILKPGPILAEDDSLGFRNFQPAIGTTEVREVFAEVIVPLLAGKPFARHLAVEAGARYSEYNAAGSVSTWKLGGEWIPVDGLRFRTMYQRAIRAPSILEAFERPLETVLDRFSADTDLCSASRDPVGNGLTGICIAQGLDPSLVGVFEAPDPNFVQFLIGGNPNLRPEESDSITAGFVWAPTNFDDLSLSVDYFSIEIVDAILDIEAGALAACFAEKDATSNLCEGYVRDDTGRIAEASNFPRNVAVQKSEGIDLQLLYSFEAPSLTLFDGPGGFELSFSGTWYMTNGSQASPLVPFFDCAGYFGFACAFSSFGTLPEVKTTTRLTYRSDPLQLSLRWRWIDSIRNSEEFFNQLFNIEDAILAIPSIGSKNYVDLSADWQISDRFSVYGGIKNLLETDPPLLAGAAPGPNTDPATYDVFGRQYFLGLTFRN